MKCVLGCLDNDLGKEIRDEMVTWLAPYHDVIEVHQSPPGSQFEYPAIRKVIDICMKTDEPVLYLHTKGSGNRVPKCYKTHMMDKDVDFPPDATPEDCQRVVRMMWKHEFTGDRLSEYLEVVNIKTPNVVCPLTGKEKLTWNNGWIINPMAAEIINRTFHFDQNRYYYECLFRDQTDINVVGMVSSRCHLEDTGHKLLWNLTWQFFDRNYGK